MFSPSDSSQVADQATTGVSKIPGAPNARSRFTKLPPTDSPAPNSRLPVARHQEGFGFGFKPSTPQPPPVLRQGFPAFKTPQLPQGTFAQRHQQRTPRTGGSDFRDPAPRSALPVSTRRSDHDHDYERDSGSELERRVNPGLGRLVVANAQIVPSSSEESTREERVGPQSGFQPLARKTATRVLNPQRRPPPHPVPPPQQARTRDSRAVDARAGERAHSKSRASIGLGFDMAPRMEMGGRYDHGETRRDADEGVHNHEEEDAYSSGGSDGEQHRRYEDAGRRRSVTSSHKRQNSVPRDFDTSVDRRNRLSGIVDGLQATYGTHRSPRKSVLSQSESDVYYEQGLAIGTSSDIPNSSMGDVSLYTSHHSQHHGEQEEVSDDDDEQSNYSETEDSFSIVVEDAEAEQVQQGGPWWMRGRKSPTISETPVEHSRGPEIEERRLSSPNISKTAQVEEQKNSHQSTGDLRGCPF